MGIENNFKPTLPLDSTLLQVKSESLKKGLPLTGVKATLDELLANELPCVISLRNPDHFLVLLDANEGRVRVLEGEESYLRVIPRSEIESRFTGIALIPTISTQTDSAHLEVSPDKYVEFTGVGQKVEYSFPIKNTGKSPLSVQIVGTTCSCTAAAVKGGNSKELMISPGSIGEIAVNYTVQSQAPDQQVVTLKTNDPRHPIVYLSVRGQLPPQISLSPPALYVAQNRGEEPNKSFKVIGPKGTMIERVSSDLPFLSFNVGQKEDDGGRIKWTVKVQGFVDAPIGPLGGKINVHLADGKQIFVSVRGNIKGILPSAADAALLPRAEDDHQTPVGSPLPTVKVGQVTPDFIATDMNGKIWKPSKLKGKNVLLTFFPKCFTGGCANHLSSLRDRQKQFAAANTQILAVSVDPAEGEKGQLAFAKEWGFTFPLIPDTSRQLGKQFGAIQNDDELAARMSVLIDKQGIVRWIDTDVHVETHGADVLTKIGELGMK